MTILQEIPSPRLCIQDLALTRPSWAIDSGRDPSLIWLDKNENSDPQLIKFTKQILNEIPNEALYTYPNSFPVYQKISKYAQVPIECLLITPGSDGVIRAVFETFINEGDVVLHTSPTFAMYPVYCKIFGAKSKTLNYSKKEDKPYLNFESILRQIKELKPKLFCLPNPDSPTGTFLSQEEIKEILELTSRQETLVLIDEAYFEFHKETSSNFIHIYKNLIVARTFAKAWGLAGLRIGYAIACSELTMYLHKVRPMYEVNTLAILFMNKMLDHEHEMKKSVQRLLEGKEYFKFSLNKFGFKTLNNSGNFQHVCFGDKSTVIHAALSNLVLYRINFSEECLNGFSRFSITTKEIFSKIISRIEEVIL